MNIPGDMFSVNRFVRTAQVSLLVSSLARLPASSLARSLVCVLASVMLLGCSGDPRPLQEAVEASNIDLARLVIQTGFDDDTPIVINPGESLQFNFKAFNTRNEEITVANRKRLWAVTISDFAEISDRGVLVGKADGLFDVGLQIGGIAAEPVRVEVSTAVLRSISSIEGQETLTECSSSDVYTARGTFDDESIRRLNNVVWSMPVNNVGRILSQDASEAVVGVVRKGSVRLTATVGGVDGISGSQTIMVAPGLERLSIAPEEVQVERSANLQLRANASYSNGLLDQSVTSLVTWSVPENNVTASVSNENDMEGLLRGLQIGTTTVTATCGDTPAVAAVTVVQPTNFIRLEIEPDEDPIRISASGGEFQLEAFSISAGGSREEITQNASWQVESGEEFVTIDNSSSTGGVLNPIAAGTATISVTFINLTERVTVIVQ